MATPFTEDPWGKLRRHTSARIALGRAGSSLPTRELLSFQMRHARAIDAVYADFDRPAFSEALSSGGIESLCVETRAESRQAYLQRPDLGRALSDASRDRVQRWAESHDSVDIAITVADGLSAVAVERNAAGVVHGLAGTLRAKGHTIAPVVLVRYGRVAVQDEIGSLLKARAVVSLIGERPGLGSPDSLGAYLVFHPRIGNTDANRNCVSNIRAGGLSTEAAVETLDWLLSEAIRRKISGIDLKDDRPLNAPGITAANTPRLP